MIISGYEFPIHEEIQEAYEYETSNKREQKYNYHSQKDARSILDSKIYELQSKIPFLISEAKTDIEEKLRFTLLKKNTQGWSIVAAGIKDIFGDFVNNDYEIKNTGQMYTYGFLFFYGLGFGFPLLVDNPDPPPIGCGEENYYRLMDRYGLSSVNFDLGYKVTIFTFTEQIRFKR